MSAETPVNTTTNMAATDAPKSEDPFAAQRAPGEDPFAKEKLDGVSGDANMGLESSPPAGRRTSKEWDASKVPPSQFQKRKGSIYATPSSRDGHTGGSDRDKAYFEKLKEKGWSIKGMFSKKESISKESPAKSDTKETLNP